jgi:hypothetical protein
MPNSLALVVLAHRRLVKGVPVLAVAQVPFPPVAQGLIGQEQALRAPHAVSLELVHSLFVFRGHSYAARRAVWKAA